MNRALQARGLVTWFDEERMEGRIMATMSAAVENTRCVIVFITDAYRNKVNGEDEKDNCQYEFSYAARLDSLGPQKMIPVVMEPGMRASTSWRGILAGNLHNKLYVDLSDVNWEAPGAAFETKMKELSDQVYRIIGKVLSIIIFKEI